jgi:predicted O-methyltransferase YrrM
MKKNLRKIAKSVVYNIPYGTKLAFIPGRFRVANSYFIGRYAQIFKWLANSNERSNFTYSLTPKSESYIAHTLAVALHTSPDVIAGYMQEPKQNQELLRHVQTASANSTFRHEADERVEFGRRLGWYATVREKKPRVVIETGVDKGLGAVLLCSALQKNSEEGHEGRYFGTDINPQAGYLLSGRYREFGEILLGDSITSLRNMTGPVDIFINDSDHSSIYEYDEYRTIASKLSSGAIILGDNAYVSDSLQRFADETGRSFLFIREDPSGHWYPGAGIGIAFDTIKT